MSEVLNVQDKDRCKRMVSGKCFKDDDDKLDEKVINKESNMPTRFIEKKRRNHERKKKHINEWKDKEKGINKKKKQKIERRMLSNKPRQNRLNLKMMDSGKNSKEDNDRLGEKVIKESKIRMRSNKKVQRNQEKRKKHSNVQKHKEKMKQEEKKKKKTRKYIEGKEQEK